MTQGRLRRRDKSLGVAHFLVGVNYWPRTTAMAMWSRFDLGEIDEDLARMAELGRSLAAIPGLYLAGNAYEGIGIPDCIRTGRRAAERIYGVAVGD